MSDQTMILNLILNGIIIVFSLGLLGISLLSYKKFRNTKLLFVSVVFFLFSLKALITVLSFFLGFAPKINSSIYAGFLDLTIIIILYLAMLKR